VDLMVPGLLGRDPQVVGRDAHRFECEVTFSVIDSFSGITLELGG
jgi:hypothetical protein